MSIECYKDECEKHNKTEPFCDEDKCIYNGNGDDVIDRYYLGETEVIVYRKDLSCWTCPEYKDCRWRDSSYNTGGDCLASK